MEIYASKIQNLITQKFTNYQIDLENTIKSRLFFIINDSELLCDPETDHLIPKSIYPIFNTKFNQKILLQDKIQDIIQEAVQTNLKTQDNISQTYIQQINSLTSNSIQNELEISKLQQQNQLMVKKITKQQKEFTKLKQQKIEHLKQYFNIGQMYVPDADNKEVQQPFKPTGLPIGKSNLKWDKQTDTNTPTNLAEIVPDERYNFDFQVQKCVLGFEKDMQTEEVEIVNEVQIGTIGDSNAHGQKIENLTQIEPKTANSQNSNQKKLSSRSAVDTSIFPLRKALKMLQFDDEIKTIEDFVSVIKNKMQMDKSMLEGQVKLLQESLQKQYDGKGKEVKVKQKSFVANLNCQVQKQAQSNNNGLEQEASESNQVMAGKDSVLKQNQVQNNYQSTSLQQAGIQKNGVLQDQSDEFDQNGNVADQQVEFQQNSDIQIQSNDNISNLESVQISSVDGKQKPEDSVQISVSSDVNSLKALPKHREIGELDEQFSTKSSTKVNKLQAHNEIRGGEISDPISSEQQIEYSAEQQINLEQQKQLLINEQSSQQQESSSRQKPRKQLTKQFSFVINEQSKLAFQLSDKQDQPLEITKDFNFQIEKKEMYHEINDHLLGMNLGEGIQNTILKSSRNDQNFKPHGKINFKNTQSTTQLKFDGQGQNRFQSNVQVCHHGIQCNGNINKDLVNSCDCEKTYIPKYVSTTVSQIAKNLNSIENIIEINFQEEKQSPKNIENNKQTIVLQQATTQQNSNFEIQTKSYGQAIQQSNINAIIQKQSQFEQSDQIVDQSQIQIKNLHVEKEQLQVQSQELNVRIEPKRIQKQPTKTQRQEPNPPRQSIKSRDGKKQTSADNINNDLEEVKNLLFNNNYQPLLIENLGKSKIKDAPIALQIEERKRILPKVPQKIEINDKLYQDQVKELKLKLSKDYDTTGYNFDRKDGVDFIHNSKYKIGNLK